MTLPQHQRIVDAILGHSRPELIFLFGSRARGDAREDSDYDILLVLPDGADAERERRGVWDALRAMNVSADVLVSGVSDYQRWQHDAGFLDWLVAREGLLLFTSGKVPRLSPRPQRVREEPREGLLMWIRRAEEDYEWRRVRWQALIPSWAASAFILTLASRSCSRR
ncbi:MAG: nucleotidyltransferase domain-containing protein [Gemmatimonadaceae bacterium]